MLFSFDPDRAEWGKLSHGDAPLAHIRVLLRCLAFNSPRIVVAVLFAIVATVVVSKTTEIAVEPTTIRFAVESTIAVASITITSITTTTIAVAESASLFQTFSPLAVRLCVGLVILAFLSTTFGFTTNACFSKPTKALQVDRAGPKRELP